MSAFKAQTLKFIAFEPPPQKAKKRPKPFWYRWLSAPLSLLLAALVFVLLVQPLKIIITPEDAAINADISFNTTLYLRWQDRFLLIPGNYQLQASASGYRPLQKAFKVTNQSLQELQLVLEPLPGHLNISLHNESVPWQELSSQLQLSVDQRTLVNNFSSQWSVQEIEAGEHRVTVNSAWHQPYEQSISIEGKGKVQELAIELQPQWAIIQIHSTPIAQVFINEQLSGNTPGNIRTGIGSQRLRLQAPGYKDYNQQLELDNLQQLQLPSIQLKPADVVVSLSSNPTQAAVLLDGNYRGLTPLQLPLSPDKTVKLQLLKDGYMPYQQKLSVSSDNKKLSKHIDLKAIEVPVTFTTQPQQAHININGKAYGNANQLIPLTATAHQIQIWMPGFQTKTFELKLSADTQPVIKTQLLTLAQALWQKTPNQITSVAGDTLLLFRPKHRIQMGSSTSEAGRRANEGQFEVNVKLPFYASTKEVTNAQFRQFAPSHSSGNFMLKSLNSDKTPVANVSWQQAALYCNWLSEKEGLQPFYKTIKGAVSGYDKKADGYRLPTEAEWTWLSRYDAKAKELGPYFIYPWGKSSDKKSFNSKNAPANLADKSAQSILKFILDNYDDGNAVSSRPGSYSAHRSGLYDLAGNVSEWANDWYQSDWFLEKQHNVWGPEIGEFHVVRGASWARGYLPQIRWSYRHYGAKGEKDVGFRIVRSVIVPETAN